MGVGQAIANGYMGKCEMVWTTAGTNRVCSRCMELRGRVVGTTEDSGVTIPPLHPRCRCTIMYQEVEPARALRPNKPKPSIMDIAPLVAIPVITEPTNPTDFDIQRFGGQKLPEGNYNLTVRRQVQNRHIEGTKEYQDYEERLSNVDFKPSKLLPGIAAQKLVYEFHGKGIYDPNPKDGSPREKINIGSIVGEYWDTDENKYVDTSWIEIVYSKRGTHIYPIRPIETGYEKSRS